MHWKQVRLLDEPWRRLAVVLVAGSTTAVGRRMAELQRLRVGLQPLLPLRVLNLLSVLMGAFVEK